MFVKLLNEIVRDFPDLNEIDKKDICNSALWIANYAQSSPGRFVELNNDSPKKVNHISFSAACTLHTIFHDRLLSVEGSSWRLHDVIHFGGSSWFAMQSPGNAPQHQQRPQRVHPFRHSKGAQTWQWTVEDASSDRYWRRPSLGCARQAPYQLWLATTVATPLQQNHPQHSPNRDVKTTVESGIARRGSSGQRFNCFRSAWSAFERERPVRLVDEATQRRRRIQTSQSEIKPGNSRLKHAMFSKFLYRSRFRTPPQR